MINPCSQSVLHRYKSGPMAVMSEYDGGVRTWPSCVINPYQLYSAWYRRQRATPEPVVASLFSVSLDGRIIANLIGVIVQLRYLTDMEGLDNFTLQ